MGQLSGETRVIIGANNANISKSLTYGYNLDGSLNALTYPSGATIAYTPDSASRTLAAVDTVNSISYVTGATYGADSALTGFVSGNTITNKFLYTPRLQPCRIIAATGGTLPASCTDTNHGNVLDLGYNFHAGNGATGSGADNGNVFGITNYKDTTRSQTFSYDALNRLTQAQNTGTNCAATTVNGKTEYWGNSYGYDAWGNLLQKTPTKCSAENLSVTANAQNQLRTGTTPEYVYDATGNMTHDATSGLNYSYDAEGRIATMGAGAASYTYDPDGYRVRKDVGTSFTEYLYFNGNVVAERDQGGNWSEYVFLNSEGQTGRFLLFRLQKPSRIRFAIRGNQKASPGRLAPWSDSSSSNSGFHAPKDGASE